jgi:hypothetical protein
MNSKQTRTPQQQAYIAVFSGAVAIITSQGTVVLTPDATRLIQKHLDQAASRAEKASKEGVFHYASASN